MFAPAGLAELTTIPVVARIPTRDRAACPRLPLEHVPQSDPGANGQQAAGQHQYCEGEHFDLPGRPLKVHFQFFAAGLAEWTKDIHVVWPPYRALKILFRALVRLNNLQH